MTQTKERDVFVAEMGRIFHSVGIGIFGSLILISSGCGSGDGAGDSSNTDNIAPVANAGLDQTVSTGQPVMLSGARSGCQWRSVHL